MSADELFSKCTSCEWDTVREILTQYPTEACSPIDTGKRGAAKISVLQVVLAHPKCRGSVPLDIIRMLLKMAPQMAETRHLYTGNLPLHAVFYNAFFSSSKRAAIAEMIIRANPQCVLMTNYDGRTPLHTNCTQHCNYEPVVALLRAAPQTAKWKDKNNELPLHLACRSQKTPNKSIRALFHAYPEGIVCKNGQGMTPLQIAKGSRVMEQRKTSRVALLTSLEVQYARAKKSRVSMTIPERDVHDEEKNCKKDAVFNHIQNFHAAHRRKLEMISNDQQINPMLWSTEKLYRNYVESQQYQLAGKLLGSPMFPSPNRLMLPNVVHNKLLQNAGIPAIPGYTTADYIQAIQMEQEKLNTDLLMKMNNLHSSLNPASFDFLRRRVALPQVVVGDEGIAETLIALKNKK